MLELLQLSFTRINIIPSTLLLIVVLFWVVTIVGAIDINGFDLDIDMDAEGIGVDIFTFLKIGDVPLSIYMSILFLIFWGLNMCVSIIFKSWGGTPNVIGFIPCFVVSALITRIITFPLKVLLKGINGNSDESKSVVGETGTLKFNLEKGKMSQVLIDGGTTLINCRTDIELELPAGAVVKVIEKVNDENIYIIEPFMELE